MDRDDELIRKHLEGDPQATRTLIETYQDMVYSLASRMLNDEDDARDAAQETFLQVLRALPKFRGECALRTWIYRIACNACIAGSKRQSRRRATEISRTSEQSTDVDVEDPTPPSLESIEQSEQQDTVRQAIGTLPEKYRIVVVLHYMESRSLAEITDILMISMSTVKIRLYRARQLLKKKLERMSL